MNFLTHPTVQYASVAPTLYLGLSSTKLDYQVKYNDCVDARAQAFHREAVPVWLPYWDNFESRSWWVSQLMLWHIAKACFPPKSNIKLSGFSTTYSNVHRPYPRGLVAPKYMQQVFETAIPRILQELMLRNGSDKSLPELNMASCKYNLRWEPHDPHESARWMRSHPFQLCRTSLSPRWRTFTRTDVATTNT